MDITILYWLATSLTYNYLSRLTIQKKKGADLLYYNKNKIPTRDKARDEVKNKVKDATDKTEGKYTMHKTLDDAR